MPTQKFLHWNASECDFASIKPTLPNPMPTTTLRPRPRTMSSTNADLDALARTVANLKKAAEEAEEARKKRKRKRDDAERARKKAAAEEARRAELEARLHREAKYYRLIAEANGRIDYENPDTEKEAVKLLLEAHELGCTLGGKFEPCFKMTEADAKNGERKERFLELVADDLQMGAYPEYAFLQDLRDGVYRRACFVWRNTEEDNEALYEGYESENDDDSDLPCYKAYDIELPGLTMKDTFSYDFRSMTSNDFDKLRVPDDGQCIFQT